MRLMRNKWRASWITLASSILLLGAIFWILHKRNDLDDLIGIWQHSNKIAIWLAVLAMMGVHLTGASRLKVIMVADGLENVGLLSNFRIQLVSQFVAHGAPISAVADLARAAMVKLRFRLSMGRSIRIIIYERVCGALGAAVVGLLAAGIQLLLPPPTILLKPQFLLWGVGLTGVAILLLAARWGANTKFELFNRTVRALGMLKEMLSQPAITAKLAFTSLAQMIGLGAVFIVLAAGMHIDVSPLQVVLFMPLIFFVSSLPIFYLGWGAREAVVIATLGSSPSVSTVEAVALSVAFGGIVFISSLPGAVFWLLRPSMRKAIETEEAELSASSFERV
jgi:hypothetical protein